MVNDAGNMLVLDPSEVKTVPHKDRELQLMWQQERVLAFARPAM